MSRYLRPRLPGAPIFFTVALAQRGGSLLIDQIGLLRAAVRATRAERPFEIAAWVVMPDHLHCIWHLPEGDCDYATRWRLIKARFSRDLPAGVRRAMIGSPSSPVRPVGVRVKRLIGPNR